MVMCVPRMKAVARQAGGQKDWQEVLENPERLPGARPVLGAGSITNTMSLASKGLN